MAARQLTLRQIEVFRAIMLTGSVTRAALSLHTSQPTATRVLGDLEEIVGFTLFQRLGRRMVPTTEARAFFKEVEGSFVGLDRLSRAAHNIATFRPGHLRIVAVTSIAVGLLPAAIAEFTGRYPEVSVALEVSDYDGVVSRILSGQCDLGFAVVPVGRPEVRIERLVDLEAVCALPQRHPLAAREVITADMLEGEPFVSLGDQFPSRPKIDAVFEDAGVQRRLIAETQAGSVACAMVQEGVGLSITDPFSANIFRDRGLAIRPFRPVIPFNYSVISPHEQPKSRLVDTFMATLTPDRIDAIASGWRALSA
ncbi:MAG: LysR substrate-binding domain-containing protein [Azospirillaceae bacterium]